MKENTVIWNEYPETMEIALPAKSVIVAENLLSTDQYKEWLYYAMKFMGVCGEELTGDKEVDMLLRAVYDEDEEFFDEYIESLLRKRNANIPIADRLKVMHAWTKEEQLNAYKNKSRKI